MKPQIVVYVFLVLIVLLPAHAFSGKGFGKPSSSNNNSFVSFDRFRAVCPEDINAIRKFEPSLIKDDITANDDYWVAVYRSSNNLPNVFVRDAFFDAMKTSTTVQDGDAETLVSTSITSVAGEGVVVSSKAEGADKPVAVARLTLDSEGISIIDSMRCTLKKEDTDPDCDGGSEHAEAIGICIDELVLCFLKKCLDKSIHSIRFDGGIRFKGTLVSGKILEERGFREATVLSSDMHSHESDYVGALMQYAERSSSKKTAKNPGGRDRALKIVSHLGRLDRLDEIKRGVKKEDGQEDDFDPWASLKKYTQ
jgi:hypothetical protein